MIRGPSPSARPIDSRGNAAVRRARALERDRSAREREGLCLAWGLRLAREVLEAGAQVRRVFAAPRLEESPEGGVLLAQLGRSKVQVLRATTRVLESIVPGCGDQGVVMEVVQPRHGLRELLSPGPVALLMAHGVQDPGNLGSMVRTAWGLGARGVVVLEGCADPFGSRSVRASMGAVFRVPVVGAATGRVLEEIGRAGIQIVAADARGGRRPSEVDLARPSAFAFGNEGAGLPAEILRAAGARVRIPMAAGAPSLNVHAAAAALLYEAFRQRGFAGAP